MAADVTNASGWWVDNRAKVDKLLDYLDVAWPWTLMVNGTSSLQPKACTFVFCQFTSNPRDAASFAIVSNMGTRSCSSSARRDIARKIQIIEGALAKRHANRARFNSPVQHPIHACGKWIRGQHTSLANTSLDFRQWGVSHTCPNTTNRVVVHDVNVSYSQLPVQIIKYSVSTNT